MVEADNTNYDDQAEEIEALQSIFTEEEFILLNSKPYSFEVMINSNTEEEERNHLKLMIRFDLPKDYPENSIPLYRIKNLCKEYLESNDLYRYEEALRERAHESIGAPMIFDLCDLIKEEITTLNDAVLNKYDIIEEKEAAQAKADALPQTYASECTTFTQVTKETFDAFVIRYKARVYKERDSRKTAFDDRPTGKAIFCENKTDFDDITLDETAPIVEAPPVEKVEEEEETEAF